MSEATKSDRHSISTNIVRAAVRCGFDPFQGPVLGLRLVQGTVGGEGGECDDQIPDATLLWLMKYLLGDSMLCVDEDLVRMVATLQLQESHWEGTEATWNWKIFMLPEIKCSVVAVLFTDRDTETNMVQALVVDHDKHSANLARCGPALAALMLTAMHQRPRPIDTQPGDGLLDCFSMVLDTSYNEDSFNDLEAIAKVADDILAGGVDVTYRGCVAKTLPWCARISDSFIEDALQKSNPEHESLLYEFLCAPSIVIVGTHQWNITKWLHTAAFFVAKRNRRKGTLCVRCGIPVSTFSLQGVLYSKQESIHTYRSLEKIKDSVGRWIQRPLLFDADDAKILDYPGFQSPNAPNAQQGMYQNFLQALHRAVSLPPDQRKMHLYYIINAFRAELDQLGQRFAESRLLVAQPSLKLRPSDLRMIVAAAHPDDAAAVANNTKGHSLSATFAL